MDHHPRKLILVIVLFSGILAGLSSALVIAIDQITLTSRGMFGFVDLTMIVILSMAGVMTGLKMGDLYIFVYNIFAGLLNSREIKLKSLM